jgi:predicted GH43/DUF377 family glycosyl hydrolase
LGCAFLVGTGLFGLSLGAPAEKDTADPAFPRELVTFVPFDGNPIFTGRGAGFWDHTIRERGWILRVDGVYRMWFTGYGGQREDLKMLGYATSSDGLTWKRHADNPIHRQRWIEDVMVVLLDGTYYMFAEGEKDHAYLLTSTDGIDWTRRGTLDIRYTDGKPLSPGAFGTPTAWHEDGIWYLFYERGDRGIWLATSRDMKVWRHVRDEPVLVPGPDAFDARYIALNQVIRHKGRYYALYHGAGTARRPRAWSTAVATSKNLVDWKKFPGNPLLGDNQSSGIYVHDGTGYRLYAMHDAVRVHLPSR